MKSKFINKNVLNWLTNCSTDAEVKTIIKEETLKNNSQIKN